MKNNKTKEAIFNGFDETLNEVFSLEGMNFLGEMSKNKESNRKLAEKLACQTIEFLCDKICDKEDKVNKEFFTQTGQIALDYILKKRRALKGLEEMQHKRNMGKMKKKRDIQRSDSTKLTDTEKTNAKEIKETFTSAGITVV